MPPGSANLQARGARWRLSNRRHPNYRKGRFHRLASRRLPHDGLKPKLAVIMIGTNNSGTDSSEDIAAGIKAIVEKLRAKLPETRILLLGIFPRGPNGEDPKRIVNAGANEIAKKLDDGQSVTYLDISDKFLQPDGGLAKEIMPDLLHLSPQGYEIWASSIEPKVAELLGEKK